ncbi:ArsR/SmtB family transcription factor [Thermodesulfobacteriota bacterium]
MSIKKAKLIEENGCLIKVINPERVDRARKESIPEKDLEHLALIYKAVGDPTRLRIAIALKGGEMCVCDLAALLGVSESAVSHQIRRMKDLALVKGRRDGQVLYYSLDDEHVADLLRIGLEHVGE